MKGFILGKEINKYTPKGATEEKIYRTLYVVWDSRATDELEGKRVEGVYCPFDISDIPVGSYCEFEYEIRGSRNGNTARLVDVSVISMADILIVPEEK